MLRIAAKNIVVSFFVIVIISQSGGREWSVFLVAVQVDGARQKVSAALSELVKVGEIEKVKRGVYRWSPEASLINETQDEPLIIIFY